MLGSSPENSFTGKGMLARRVSLLQSADAVAVEHKFIDGVREPRRAKLQAFDLNQFLRGLAGKDQRENMRLL